MKSEAMKRNNCDYRRIIEELRAKPSRDSRELLDAAADAIETLLNGIEAYRQAAKIERIIPKQALNVYRCWLAGEDWGCFVVAASGTKARSLFYDRWKVFSDARYTDSRCQIVRWHVYLNEGVYEDESEELEKQAGVKYTPKQIDWVKENAKEHEEVQREKRSAYQAAYYAAHREEIAAKNAAYRAAHRDEFREYMREYQRKKGRKNT